MKMVNHTNGCKENPKKPYYLAEHLTFLDTFIKKRKSRGKSHPQSLELVYESDDSQPSGSNNFGDFAESLQHHFSESSNSSTPEAAPKQSQLKRKTQSQTVSDANNAAFRYPSFEAMKKPRSEANQYDDPDEAFLKSMLTDMKMMNDYQKRNFKAGVLNLAGQILNQPLMIPPVCPITSNDVKPFSFVNENDG